jgi:hypothetical protein
MLETGMELCNHTLIREFLNSSAAFESQTVFRQCVGADCSRCIYTVLHLFLLFRCGMLQQSGSRE